MLEKGWKNSKRISYCRETQYAVASVLLEVDQSINMSIDRKLLNLLAYSSIDSFLQKQKECRQKIDLGCKTQKTFC